MRNKKYVQRFHTAFINNISRYFEQRRYFRWIFHRTTLWTNSVCQLVTRSSLSTRGFRAVFYNFFFDTRFGYNIIRSSHTRCGFRSTNESERDALLFRSMGNKSRSFVSRRRFARTKREGRGKINWPVKVVEARFPPLRHRFVSHLRIVVQR